MIAIPHRGDATATKASIDAVLGDDGYRTALNFGRDGEPAVRVVGPDKPWCRGLTIEHGQRLVLGDDGALNVEDTPNHNHHQEQP